MGFGVRAGVVAGPQTIHRARAVVRHSALPAAAGAQAARRCGWRVAGSEFRIWKRRFRVQGFGFGVCGSESLWIWGFGFWIFGLRDLSSGCRV